MWHWTAQDIVDQALQGIDAVASLFGLTDRLLRKIESSLHWWKRRSLEKRVAELDAAVGHIENQLEQIQTDHRELVDAVAELERKKSEFFAADMLTVGISYFLRRGYRSAVQRRLKEGLDRLDAGAGKLVQQKAAILGTIASIEEKLARSDPSLLGRIVGFFRRIVGILGTAISFIQGRIISGLVGTYRLALAAR